MKKIYSLKDGPRSNERDTEEEQETRGIQACVFNGERLA